jgi:hypothetical protein
VSYILYDPDEYESVSKYDTCAFHKLHPGEKFAWCGCSLSMTQRRRSPEEYAAIKAERRRKEEDGILAQAEIIKASRALLSHPDLSKGGEE